MQDFTNFNQPQPVSADGYSHDPLESIATEQELNKEEEKKEPAKIEVIKEEEPKEEPVVLNQEPEPEAEPEVAEETEPGNLSPELQEYLNTTKKLLEQTRQERNNLIVRIDGEEDKITAIRKKQNDDPEHFEAIDYGPLNGMRNDLYRKNDLIHALIGVIRSLE